ncbi:MAG: hypothetical protein JNL39_04260 [Opitutaceae bacterium]|nr:hypothetical protein [Opitutaceae bacterium]
MTLLPDPDSNFTVKALSLLLAASLVANIAFVAVAVTRSPSATTPAGPAATPPRNSGAPSDALRTALASGNVAALEAAGLSPEQARELALGRTIARIAAKHRSAPGQPVGDGRWWLTKHTAATRDAQQAARRELAAALGIDLGVTGEVTQFPFLPPEKSEKLRQILADYQDMMGKFTASGLQLPSDREKLRLLQAERERDIASLLSPEEKLAYDLRTSASAATVRNRFGEAIASEAEFEKLYALQKAFDEKFSREALSGRISPETLRARAEAERQLDADLRAAVGDDRYAALRRAADSDVRNIDSLVSRLSLPPATTDAVLAARDTYAAQSQRIANDTSIPFPERRTQIQTLATQAKAEVTRSLGAEAGAAYAQASPWLSMLSSGTAYSTQPQASSIGTLGLGQQSVYPVLPAGIAPTGSGARQVFISGTPAFDTAIPAPGGVVERQVMTFTTTEHATTTVTPPAGAVIVTPPATTPQPAPKP